MVKDEGAFRWRSREQKYRASRCRLCDKYLSRERSRGRVGMLSRPRPYDPAVNHALRAKHRARAIAIYGGRCVWCGSTDDLEFDHPNNDGKAHRAAEGVDMMVSRISRTGRPLEDWTVQLLCRPCHRGRRWPKRRAAGRPDWRGALLTVGSAALACVLTALIAAPVNVRGSASFLPPLPRNRHERAE
jgi:5-methylcytosine-specific restriction endonuclease McrA